MKKRFHSLKLIGSILKFLGVIGLIYGFINLVVVPLALSSADSLIIQIGFTHARPGSGLIAGVLLGLLSFLVCEAAGMLIYAVGESFNVLIAIEENTRLAAQNREPGK